MSDASEHKSASAMPPEAADDAARKEAQPDHGPLLEQAVDDLLHQMDEAEQSVKAAVDEETQKDLDDLAVLTKEAQAPAGTPQEGYLTDVVDALLDQQEEPSSAETAAVAAAAKTEAAAPVAEEVAGAPAHGVATEPTAQSTTDQTAAAPVEILTPADFASVASAPVAAVVPQPQEAVKPEVTPTLADLDRELAGVANEMLAKEQIAPPVPTQSTPVVRATEPVPQAVVQEVAAATDAAEKTEDHAHAHSRAQQAKAAMHTAIAHASPKAKAAGSWLKVHVEPSVIAMLAGISKPIASKSKAFKHSLGLVALYTLFVASAFWGYALFLRPTQASTTEAQPFDFQKSGLPSPEVAEHGESGHVEANAEVAGHGEAKKKDDGHGGGGHGEANGGKKEAKKPVLNSADAKSVINKTLEDRKKKPAAAKKDGGGHGGGH